MFRKVDGFGSGRPLAETPQKTSPDCYMYKSIGETTKINYVKIRRQFELIDTKIRDILTPTGEDWLEKFKIVPMFIRPELKNKGFIDVYLPDR